MPSRTLTGQRTTNVVDTRTKLRRIRPAERFESMLVSIRTDDSLWIYDAASTAPAGAQCLVPEDGVGRWYSLGRSRAPITQASWWLDPTNGDDDSDGSSSLIPIKTCDRLYDALKAASLVGAASSAISPIVLNTIYILNNAGASDPLRLQVRVPSNSLIAVIGSANVIASGTFSAVTAQAPGSNTAWTVTDVTKNWTTYLKKRIRNTTVGPNLGQIAHVAKDLGGGVAMLSTPNNPSLPAPANALDALAPPDRLFQTAVTDGVFSAGDTYVIEDLTDVILDDIEIGSPFQGTATLPVIGFAHINFQKNGTNAGAAVRLPSGAIIPNFKGCRFEAAAGTSWVNQAYNFENCCFAGAGAGGGAINIVRGSVFVRGGLSTGQVSTRPGTFLSVDNDFMVRGVSGNSVNVIGGTAMFVKMCVFDGSSNAISQGNSTSNAGGYSDANVGTRLWGSGNAGFGVDQGAGCKLRYNSGALPNIKITGTSGDFRQAGATTHTSFAGATPTTGIPNNWASIVNNNAHNVERDCFIGQLN